MFTNVVSQLVQAHHPQKHTELVEELFQPTEKAL
jgi:hypothetical protein